MTVVTMVGSELVHVNDAGAIHFGVVAAVGRGFSVNLDGGARVERVLPEHGITAVVLAFPNSAPIVRFEYTLSPGVLFDETVVRTGFYAVREIEGVRCPCCGSIDHVELGTEANHCIWCEAAWIPGEDL